jgi:hypothetical protein
MIKQGVSRNLRLSIVKAYYFIEIYLHENSVSIPQGIAQLGDAACWKCLDVVGRLLSTLYPYIYSDFWS